MFAAENLRSKCFEFLPIDDHFAKASGLLTNMTPGDPISPERI